MIKIPTFSTRVLFSFYTLVFLLAIWISTTPLHATNGINIDSSSGLAIHGYDPVAYFTESKPVEGKPEFTVKHQDNQWAFSSEKNKNTFLKNPDSYIPQYGGHCAYAASKNALANTDPFAWTVYNKKLYLNYSIGTRDIWLKQRDANIVDADGFWPELMKQVP